MLSPRRKQDLAEAGPLTSPLTCTADMALALTDSVFLGESPGQPGEWTQAGALPPLWVVTSQLSALLGRWG